ncbi:hypothetical protein [Streptomyces sp. CB01635]|uniref:hypothetical protein n=1 Tax=unclassified Streptomyces TaxID=2593676 RepID=UPI001F2118E1|nr:hypothetical protein [Streptomyces sp. CB01635]
MPGPRDGAADSAPSVGLPPHLPGADELGDDADVPDWWRVEPAPFRPGETVPGIVVGGLVVWLWGWLDGRWGEPSAQERLGQEMADGLPGIVRVAAVASALFLVWRMRRVPR